MKATAKTPSRWAVLALTAILRPANAPTALRLNPAAPHRSPSGEGWKKGTARGLSRAEKAAGVRRGPRPAGAAADTAPGQAPSSGHPPATSSRCGPGARPPPGTGTPPPPRLSLWPRCRTARVRLRAQAEGRLLWAITILVARLAEQLCRRFFPGSSDGCCTLFCH